MAPTVHKIPLFFTEVISVQDGCVHAVKHGCLRTFFPLHAAEKSWTPTGGGAYGATPGSQ